MFMVLALTGGLFFFFLLPLFFSYEGELNYSEAAHSGRVRSFPHVEGNYALHVFIPGLYFVLTLFF